MPRPSAAASRATVQIQGFHPTSGGLPRASERQNVPVLLAHYKENSTYLSMNKREYRPDARPG